MSRKSKNLKEFKRNFRVVKRSDLKPWQIERDIKNVKLPVLDPEDKAYLDQFLNKTDGFIRKFNQLTPENRMILLSDYYEFVLSEILHQKYKNNNPWLSLLTGYYGILAFSSNLESMINSMFQSLLINLRDTILFILNEEDEVLFEQFANFLLKNRYQIYSENYATELEELIASLIVNRNVDNDTIEGIIQSFISEELSLNIEKSKKNPSFRTQDNIGRLHSIKLDLFFHRQNPVSEEDLDTYYQTYRELPYVSRLYFMNLFRIEDYTKLYRELEKAESVLSSRFDSYTVLSGYNEFSHTLLHLIREMLLTDQILPYLPELIIKFLSYPHHKKDLKVLFKLLLAYAPEEVVKKTKSSVYESKILTDFIKAEVAYITDDRQNLFVFIEKNPDLLNIYYDRLLAKDKKKLNEFLRSIYYRKLPETLNKRSQYTSLLDELEAVGKDLTDQNFISEILETWKVNYPRKRALQEEIERFKKNQDIS